MSGGRFQTIVMDNVSLARKYPEFYKLVQAMSWVALGWWRCPIAKPPNQSLLASRYT